MRFIDNGGVTDPRLNLALEEYALGTVDIAEDHLLFYVNEPSIIIGRHQNTIAEINREVVEARGIHVVRRMSGGGAVYHDLGNLNFSIFTRYDPKNFSNYERFTRPVIEVLRGLGVPAELSGRNDITAGGRKISGNAQFVLRDRMLSHGTLLFDTNLDDVTAALNVGADKIESKGIQSIRSRVANITEFLEEPMGIEALRELLLRGIFGERVSAIPRHELSEADRGAVRRLAAEKYGSRAWNFGASPPFNIRRSRRFSAGGIEARVFVEKGVIRNVRFYGDFFARADIGELEARLVGAAYERDALRKLLETLDVGQYFGDVSAADVAALLD